MVRLAFMACAIGALVPAVDALAAMSDDFNDNVQAATWNSYTQDPDKLTISETGGRLVASSVAPAYDHYPDALYQSDGAAGFALSTGHDFQMHIDYNLGQLTQFTGFTPGAKIAFAMDIGIGTDASGANAVSIGYGMGGLSGFGALPGLFAADRVGGTGPDPSFANGSGSAGTLYVSYDAGLDEVYLSDAGYGSANADFTYTGLVQGQWGASQVIVGFGARGNAFGTDDADSYLDNFVVDSGTIVPIPEPATLGLLSLGALMLARRRQI